MTKTWPVDLLLAAYEAGIRDFGENRAEELAEKRLEVEGRLGRELYDAFNDPGELQNLAPEPAYAPAIAELRRLLAQLRMPAAN